MAEWWESVEADSGDKWWDTVSREHSDWWSISTESEADWYDIGSSLQEGEWLGGNSRSLPIWWYWIHDWIPVSQEGEITQVTVEVKTQSHPEGGFFDAFSLKRSLFLDKIFGPERTDLPLEATNDDAEIPLFGAVEQSVVKAVYILPESAVSGHDTDYMVLKLVNKETGGLISSKTYTAGNDLEAWKPDLFGPPASAHATISEGESASLVVEKVGAGFTIPRSVIIVLWDIS